MYFYISFLRPPPCIAHPSKPIPITPQISNDLRTELFNGPQDIFYSWISASDPHSQTNPRKLTTWRETTAFKEIQVPGPPTCREGQRWQLALTADSKNDGHLVDFVPATTRNPFPVFSEPILFSSKTASIRKQENTERVYRLSRNDKDASLILREQLSFDLDKVRSPPTTCYTSPIIFQKIWDSGIGLSSWLWELHDDPSPFLNDLKDILFSDRQRKILELGPYHFPTE
jgi:hypothetical protein